jgi:hypothetical protein
MLLIVGQNHYVFIYILKNITNLKKESHIVSAIKDTVVKT